MRLILGQGLALTVAGVALGVVAALTVTGTMRTLLYSVDPTDPFTFVAVPILLIVVALAACYVPARRAMRVDSLIALRSE
jgi:putative ABC transport system permease protein